jgi:hypothetical protein
VEKTGDVGEPTLSVATTLAQPGFGLVLDVGRQRRKRIRRLKQGTGKLRTQVESVVNEAMSKFGLEEGVEIVPVVILYRCSDKEPALPRATPMLEDGRA